MSPPPYTLLVRFGRFIRRALAAALLCLCLAAGFLLYLGHRLTQPAPAALGPAPDQLKAEVMHFPSTSGSLLSGWLSAQPDAKGVVLLLHGVRSNKRSMTERALFLKRIGYNTLCLDLQSHGESTGSKITMGYLEAQDVASAVTCLRSRFPALPIAALGVSLGGAAAALARHETAPDAFILEAVFSDIETAIKNRLEMRLGSIGRLASPLLTLQIEPRIGVPPDTLSPLQAVSRISQPIFFIYGTEDRHAKLAEGRALFAAAQGPKEIWEIAGAAHVDFHSFDPTDYEQRVGAFLSLYLKK